MLDRIVAVRWTRAPRTQVIHQDRAFAQPESITGEKLTAHLVERLLGWRVGPERYLIGHRGWIPRGRFQPLVRIEDAFRLLDEIDGTYILANKVDGTFTAEVAIDGRLGTALGMPKAATITLAIARAIGLVPQNVSGVSRPQSQQRKGGARVR